MSKTLDEIIKIAKDVEETINKHEASEKIINIDFCKVQKAMFYEDVLEVLRKYKKI